MSLFDIPLKEACQFYDVDRRIAMRWLDSKRNPLKSEKRRLPSGRLGIWVNENDFLVKQNDSKPCSKAFLFFLHCLEAGANPKKTLRRILRCYVPEEHGELTSADADLAYAGIRLILDPQSRFLSYLTTERSLEDSFESEIARLHGPSYGYAYDGSDRDPEEFERFWARCWKEVRQGYGRTISVGLAARRDFLQNGRPEYLNSINCTEIPDWALRSVTPFHIPGSESTYSSVLARMNERASNVAALRDHLPTIVLALRELTPIPLLRQESNGAHDGEDDEIANSTSSQTQPTLCSKERKYNLDPVAREEIARFAKELAGEPFLIPETEAAQWCIAVYVRVHHDALAEVKGRRNGGYKPLPRSTVNKIFGYSSRGIKASPG